MILQLLDKMPNGLLVAMLVLVLATVVVLTWMVLRKDDANLRLSLPGVNFSIFRGRRDQEHEPPEE
jgi:hypothetical protein